MNLLFVCSRNRWRSPTAEKLFHGKHGIVAKSAGTSPSARIRVNASHVHWADIIFVMEDKHSAILNERWPDRLAQKKVIVLEIPDEYKYMDDELADMLQTAVLSAIDTHPS